MDKGDIAKTIANTNNNPLPYTQSEILSFIAPTVMKMLRSNKKSDVIHRETCPVCGKRLVNLYRYNKEWLCKMCKIAAEKIDERINEC